MLQIFFLSFFSLFFYPRSLLPGQTPPSPSLNHAVCYFSCVVFVAALFRLTITPFPSLLNYLVSTSSGSHFLRHSAQAAHYHRRRIASLQQFLGRGKLIMRSIKFTIINDKLHGVLVSRFGFTRVELFMAR